MDPQPQQPWILWKLTSTKIAEAIDKHRQYRCKFYSRLALALAICDEFQKINDWESRTGQDDFFHLLEVKSIPLAEDESIVVETIELKVANNYTTDKEYLKFKLVFDKDLAGVIPTVVRPNDCILLWGGRLCFRDNERIIDTSYSSMSSNCEMVVISNVGFEENISLIDEIPLEVRNKVIIDTVSDCVNRKIVKVVPINKKIIGIENDSKNGEEMDIPGDNVIIDNENNSPIIPTCSKYLEMNVAPALTSQVTFRKRRIQNIQSSTQQASISNVLEPNHLNSSISKDKEQSNQVEDEDYTSASEFLSDDHLNLLKESEKINEDQSPPAKVPKMSIVSQCNSAAKHFLMTQEYQYDTQNGSQTSQSHLNKENTTGTAGNKISNPTNVVGDDNNLSVNISDGKDSGSVIISLQSRTRTPQRAITNTLSQMSEKNENVSPVDEVRCFLESQRLTQTNSQNVRAGYLLGNNLDICSKNITNCSSSDLSPSKSPHCFYTNAKSPQSLCSSTEQLGRTRSKSKSLNNSGTSHLAVQIQHDHSAQDMNSGLVLSCGSRRNASYNLKEAVVCLERLDSNAISCSAVVNNTKRKRKPKKYTRKRN